MRTALGVLVLTVCLAAGCIAPRSAGTHLPPLVGSRDAEAVAQYEAAVRRDPACAEGWVALGTVAFTDGRFEAAETSFRRALTASPHHPAACNNLAMTILARGGSLMEAEALAREALAQPGPLRPYILDTLANIQLRRRRYAEALDLLDQAEAATPPGGQLVRDQLKATRDRIQAAAAVRDHAPGQVPR